MVESRLEADHTTAADSSGSTDPASLPRRQQSIGVRGKSVKAALHFATSDREQILVKVGISAVSAENARQNLEAEIPGWDFDATHQAAREAWRSALSRIEIEGGTTEEQTIFYTALYHTLLQPNLFTDVNGEYRGRDGNTHTAKDHTQYTVFSLWDTFRAAHPLYTILEPARTVDFVKTFLAQYREGGLLPVWELAGNETMCMIGYHSASVIADAWAKGIRSFDAELALTAMKGSAVKDHLGIPSYRRHGFIPSDHESESVSKTLEYAYDDWCIAQLASALGRSDDEAQFLRRAQSWKNILDPETGFMRPKIDSRWKSPFRPTDVDFNFTEANSWQYSFFVPQDVNGLIDALGGDDAFVARLDSLFAASPQTTGREQADITGLIGQYAHGNEPSHHMAYLYAFAGQPWKTQARVREILSTLYAAEPDGLSGNEDCGQMSAWFVLSALGFYSVTPGQDTYVLGSPLFDRATLHLENGRTFTIAANRESDSRSTGPYVQSATLNGTPFDRCFLRHEEITSGGELSFVLGGEPNLDWGAGPGKAPVSRIDLPYQPVPYVASGESPFRERTEIVLALPAAAAGLAVSATAAADSPKERVSAATIRYTLDGTDPEPHSSVYHSPIPIEGTTRIRFAAIPSGEFVREQEDEPSHAFVQEATFRMIDHARRLVAGTVASPQYPGGTPEALIDGVRGGPDFRLGAWQGFEGIDMEATVDLGTETPIHRLSLGCLQDQNSWIFFPSRVTYEVSSDGVTFLPVGQVDGSIDSRADGSLLHEFATPPIAASGRYVRVRAQSLRTCPEWHKGAGHPCWIFVDELTIE